MFTAILDANSPFHAGLPENDQPDKLVTVGDTFLAYDRTLPPEQQSPFADDIAQLLQFDAVVVTHRPRIPVVAAATRQGVAIL